MLKSEKSWELLLDSFRRSGDESGERVALGCELVLQTLRESNYEQLVNLYPTDSGALVSVSRDIWEECCSEELLGSSSLEEQLLVLQTVMSQTLAGESFEKMLTTLELSALTELTMLQLVELSEQAEDLETSREA